MAASVWSRVRQYSTCTGRIMVRLGAEALAIAVLGFARFSRLRRLRRPAVHASDLGQEIEELRAREYARLDRNGHVYFDCALN